MELLSQLGVTITSTVVHKKFCRADHVLTLIIFEVEKAQNYPPQSRSVPLHIMLLLLW